MTYVRTKLALERPRARAGARSAAPGRRALSQRPPQCPARRATKSRSFSPRRRRLSPPHQEEQELSPCRSYEFPPRCAPITQNQDQVTVPASTVREVLAALEAGYPGIGARLFDEKGAVRATSTSSTMTRTFASSRSSTRRWARPTRSASSPHRRRPLGPMPLSEEQIIRYSRQISCRGWEAKARRSSWPAGLRSPEKAALSGWPRRTWPPAALPWRRGGRR